MAPVGSYESLHPAINAGCDSIFFGITQLNMRAKASQNLNIEDLLIPKIKIKRVYCDYAEFCSYNFNYHWYHR